MRYLKIGIISIAILFTAQACNFLFGEVGSGPQMSGPKGMYVSEDSGETWAEINTVVDETTIKNADVSQIFVEPGNVDNLLVATSDTGVFASDTGGELWVNLLPRTITFSVFISPADSQELYAAGANTGKFATVWKSPDRGGIWEEIFSESSGRASVSALTFDPVSPGTFYAALSTGTVIKSTDFGSTWNVLIEIDGRIEEIVVARDSQRSVYVLSAATGPHRSTDGGFTWSRLTDGLTGRSFTDIHLDERNQNTLYVGSERGLFRSRDKGNSWHRVELPVNQQESRVSAVTVSPDNSLRIFAAINWTVYKSNDAGVTWRTVSLPTRRRISDIVVDPNQLNRVYAGVR